MPRSVDGIHLRGGPVARGGIRFSDRLDDFRTEVLGPDAHADAEERADRAGRREGRLRAAARGAQRRARRASSPTRSTASSSRACFDLTDDLDDARRRRAAGRRTSPRPDDPYLVVAADKGTAHLSDAANAIALDARLLARRRVRVGRLGGLRPQGVRDHRARRLGVRQAPLRGARHRPRARRLSPPPASATCRATSSATGCSLARRAQPPRRVRPPARLPRSGSRSRGRVGGAQAPLRPPAVELGGLRPDEDRGGRRRLAARREEDRALRAGARACSGSPPARSPATS